MIVMDAEQAAEFFGTGPVPANVIIETRAEADARIAALLS